MTSRNIYFRQGWVCPTCNNGDDHLNAVDECKQLYRSIDSVSKVLEQGEIWCVNKVCVKCMHRCTFKTNNSYTHHLLEMKP